MYHGTANFSLKDYLFINLTVNTKKYIAYAGATLVICLWFILLFMKGFTLERQIISTIFIFIFIFLSFVVAEIITLIKKLKKYPHSIGVREFIITKEGFQTKNLEKNEAIFFIWDEFQCLINRKKFWLLKINDQQIKVIPHAAFNETKIKEITQFISDNIEI